ncbi:MAG: septum formation initiator family protein [Candidatus Coatesbacteria bacterium]|nr:MAG: septum formation initiator family protein [Candidatus Coatesbacteria bacterium]
MAGSSRIRVVIRLALLGGVIIVVLYLFVFSRYGFMRLKELEAENAGLENRITAVEAENAELRYEIERMESDMEAIERLARTDLGLIKEGDEVYRFVEGDDANAD